MIRKFGGAAGIDTQPVGLLLGQGTGGTAAVADVLSGKTFTNDTGQKTGTLALTGSGTAANVLNGSTFYNTDPKTKITGTMPNNGAVAITPSTIQQAIAVGYHNGSGVVAGDADLVAANIKKGINIFGVVGVLPAPDIRVADLYANTRVPSKDGYSYDIGYNGYYCVAKYTMSGTFIGFIGPSTGSASIMSGIDDYRDQIIALYTGGSYVVYRLTKGGTLVSSYYENYINMNYPGAIVYAENYVFGFRFYSGQNYIPCSTAIDGTYIGHCTNILLTLPNIGSTHLADLGDGNLLILGPVSGIMSGGSPSSGKAINMHQGSLGKFISVKS